MRDLVVMLMCIGGATLCFSYIIYLLCQPPEHEIEGCIQKPRGWHKR